MKNQVFLVSTFLLLLTGCTSQKKLAYLNNLPETGGEETFTMEIPGYKIQNRDVLYITIKAMTPEGRIIDFLLPADNNTGNQITGEAGSYLYGYDVNSEGNIILPAIGTIKVEGLVLEDNPLYWLLPSLYPSCQIQPGKLTGLL